MKFTEAQLEAAIIELLSESGYPHVLGETIDRQPDEVLIEADLRGYLSQRYAPEGITPVEVNSVIQQLKNYSAADLYSSNKEIMQKVADGFLLKREDHKKKDLFIELIDYAGLDKPQMSSQGENIFKLVNQLKIEGKENRIPDAILYINGLPLVVFEFKTAIEDNKNDPRCLQATDNTLQTRYP